jgi:hypothetical protein
MFDTSRRCIGRLFHWLVAMVMITGFGLTASGTGPAPQSGAATTTIADTVFLADGDPERGI